MIVHLYDVIVVGAGISGCVTAANLSHKGLNVLLIDKDFNHCYRENLWIAEKRVLELLDDYTSESILTGVSDIRIKNLENTLSFQFKEPGLYVLDSGKLCRNLYSQCVEICVNIKNDHVIDIKIEDYYVEVRTNSEIYRSKYLVGADGVNSTVGRKTGINTAQYYCIGIEALYKTDKSFNNGGMEIDFSTIPYGFSTALNCNGMLFLYGASFYGGKVDIKKYFGDYNASMGLNNDAAYYTRGNLIPFNKGVRQNYVNKRVMLVGGAAGISNPLTASALYYAVKSSMICSKIILDKINTNEENTNWLTRFNREMNGELLREVRELYPLSRLVYNNMGFFFRVIKHVPYMAKHFAALLCGRMDSNEKRLSSLVLPWKGKNCIHDIGIIK